MPTAADTMEREVFSLVILVLASSASMAQLKSEESLLLRKILADTEYDKRVKPTVKPGEQMLVYVQFGLARVESLDEKRQIMSSFGWLMATWQDNLLQWDPVSTQIDMMIIPADTVWLPEIAMLNSVDEGTDLSMDTDFRVSVASNGKVTWIPGFWWRTACSVDLTYFPFDRQTCEIKFINWMYTGLLLNYTVDSPDVILDNYDPNGEWNLAKAEQYIDLVYVKSFPGVVYPQVVLHLTLERMPMYFVMNVILPSVLITFLSITVYWVPYESGEKVSLGITVLLSFSIVLLMVSDVTPRNGTDLPIISWYILATMTITGLSMILTIAILNIYHHDPSTPVPEWVDKLVLGFLARGLCMHSNESNVGNSVRPSDVTVEHMASEKPDPSSVGQKYPLMPPEVMKCIHQWMNKEIEKDTIDNNKGQWARVGKVIDRFCLVSSFIAMFLTTVIMFPVLSTA